MNRLLAIVFQPPGVFFPKLKPTIERGMICSAMIWVSR